MALEEIVDQIDKQTTRRKVVATGVKLAYAAPVMAATMKLTAARASAISGQHPECEGASCATFIPCSSANPDCVCVSTPQGGFCVPGSTACAGLEACAPDNTCPADSVCAIDTCCGSPVCVPIELTRACPLDATGAAAAGARSSSGPGTLGG